jgi:hypothetical protein
LDIEDVALVYNSLFDPEVKKNIYATDSGFDPFRKFGFHFYEVGTHDFEKMIPFELRDFSSIKGIIRVNLI